MLSLLGLAAPRQSARFSYYSRNLYPRGSVFVRYSRVRHTAEIAPHNSLRELDRYRSQVIQLQKKYIPSTPDFPEGSAARPSDASMSYAVKEIYSTRSGAERRFLSMVA